jgi:serpin B
MRNILQRTILLAALGALVIAGCGPMPVEPSPLPTVTQGSGASPLPTKPSGNEAVAILGPDGARDEALAYLAQSIGIQVVPADMVWTEENTTPEGLVGASTVQYSSGDWVVTVSYPVVLPENTVYHVVVINQSTGFRWEGDVNAQGQVTEGTGTEGQGGPTPTVSDADLAALAGGNSAFAFNLYQVLRREKGNFFYSPYSISLALAMTYAGARSGTEKEMAQALHFLLPQDRLHPAFSRLAAELASRGEGAAGKDGKGFRLNVANSLWAQQDYQFLQQFLDLLVANYGAGVRPVDFAGDPEAARQTINDWVSKETEGRIEDLIPPGAIDTLTRLVLANAIYFNAAWLYPFQPDRTVDGPFNLLDGSQVQVPMMRQTGSFSYAEGDGYQAVELPYDGQQLSMVILLPEKGQFDAFEATLDATRVDAILKSLAGQQVALTMPNFEFESQFSLKDSLSALGMPNAFTDAADFSGMTGNRELSISEVAHKAFVSVDEAGTEAAAATAVIVGVTSAPAEPVTFTADRPFLFLIRDIPTGTILFVGRLADPTA